MRRTSRAFTVMEIMVALAIMVSLLGWAGFNIRGAWREQAFRSECDRLLDRLRLAQDILLTLNVETELRFTPEGVKWVPVGMLNRLYDKLIVKEKLPLDPFAEVIFEEAGGEKKVGTFTLKFLDQGYILSKGILKLVAHTGEEAYITLPGYPAPLSLERTPPNPSQLDLDERKLYEGLTAITLSDPDVQSKK